MLPVYIRERVKAIKALIHLSKPERHKLINDIFKEQENLERELNFGKSPKAKDDLSFR
jgi:hypothetical protein